MLHLSKIMKRLSYLCFILAGSLFAQQPADTLNVKSNGAVGDGTTDDTEAINNTITKAHAEGKVVYFPSGQYKITSQVTLMDGVNCYGDASGVSIIKASSKIVFGHPDKSQSLKNVEIKDLFFMNTRLDIVGASKDNITIRQCVFACAITNINTSATGNLTNFRGKNSSFDCCIFLCQDNSWNQKGLTTYSCQNLTVQHCIFGLDLGNLNWLSTEWSGYSNWKNPALRLESFRSSQGLNKRMGALRGAIRFNEDDGVICYSNILNFDPVFCSTDQSLPEDQRPDIDHVIYATQVKNLEFVSNWVRGQPNSPAGGFKHRNTNGPGVVAANYFHDTPIILYSYTGDLNQFENQLIYRNWLKVTTPLSEFQRNSISYYPNNDNATETDIQIAQNTFECADGFSNININNKADRQEFKIYRSNVFSPSGTVVPINNNDASYTSGNPPSSLTSPYDGCTVPVLNIPEYCDPTGSIYKSNNAMKTAFNISRVKPNGFCLMSPATIVVDITIYSVKGSIVQTIDRRNLRANNESFITISKRLPNGVHFITVRGENCNQISKIIIRQ